MGEIDLKAFQHACSLKFSDGEREEMSVKLCSSWQESLKNPHWHPFKRVIIKGKLQIKHVYHVLIKFLKIAGNHR
ncbi:hypothetical protein Patl1_06412 [Pistacia atlantica]|uniref:Uncharacterized protein n=1 Tax=Pistacia atlantica TaxID=434234 RepID=A0ACC1BVB6_9ROSI|nr:hypothetical protein Patl1_06412 [Pistacia atlantica]